MNAICILNSPKGGDSSGISDYHVKSVIWSPEGGTVQLRKKQELKILLPTFHLQVQGLFRQYDDQTAINTYSPPPPGIKQSDF